MKKLIGLRDPEKIHILYQHRPQIAKNNFCVINVEKQCNICKKLKTKCIVVFLGVWVKLVALNIEGGYETEIGTLQWHPAKALRPLPQSTPQWHPAMALRPLPQSWSSPSPPPTIAHNNGTQQWHYVHSPNHSTLEMAPCNGTTSTPPKLVVTLSFPHHSTRQWHPTMAPSNGTTSTALCNGTRVPCPIRQSGSSPSPLLEVRTPIAIAIWGIIKVFLVTQSKWWTVSGNHCRDKFP